jgi:hypothetical protein
VLCHRYVLLIPAVFSASPLQVWRDSLVVLRLVDLQFAVLPHPITDGEVPRCRLTLLVDHIKVFLF